MLVRGFSLALAIVLFPLPENSQSMVSFRLGSQGNLPSNRDEWERPWQRNNQGLPRPCVGHRRSISLAGRNRISRPLVSQFLGEGAPKGAERDGELRRLRRFRCPASGAV
jgi:hypothetical protein